MTRPPAVVEGTFELPSGRVVSVGDASWFFWLDSPDARSFRFEGRSGTFTARKETPKAGKPYWTAVRRHASKLHKSYLGASATLTLERLEEAAEKLANPEIRESKRPARAIQSVTSVIQPVTPPVNSVTSALTLNLLENQDFQQLRAQVEELQNRVTELCEELHGSIGNSGEEGLPGKEDPAFLQQLTEVTEEREALKRRNAELEDRLADLAARAGVAFEANKELRRQVAEVTEERDALSRRNAELESQLGEFSAREEEVSAANRELRERVAEVTEERDALERKVQELGQQLAAAGLEREELCRRNSELDSEAGFLAAKVGDLDLANQELRQQLAAAVAEREALERTNQEILRQLEDAENPPAATESAPPPDLPAICERSLSKLRLGKQAPGYKTAARALSYFVKELESCLLLTPPNSHW